EALQLAIYVGYLKRGWLGGVFAGLTFIIPGAVAMIVLSFLYVHYGNLPWVTNMLLVLKPAVLGIIAAGIIKLGRAALKNAFLGILAVSSVLAMIFLRADFLLVLFAAGAINLAFAELREKKLTGLPKWFGFAPLAGIF